MNPNLLQRAKPELIEALNKGKEEYPHLVESITKELQNNFWFTDLTYGTMNSIKIFTNSKDIDSVILLFN